ncbi:hypothetical protein CTAYLR_006975 [Chrysophaeum taylorii]|uniref:G protein gamma domain-containing protein n=1 Tax=Chrysophaeum taylorii TaxID=2483200 RepID=A0AAD7XGS8_9STRA|nr:hypothetical protein CTAYLR_006975 [Chrysophaeum taylorii]
MSQQQLAKIEAEVSRLEKDVEQYKSAQTKTTACAALTTYIKENQSTADPFSSDYPNPNPFHSTTGAGNSCCVLC